MDPARLRGPRPQGDRAHLTGNQRDEAGSHGRRGVPRQTRRLQQEYNEEMEQEEDDMPVFGDNLMEMMNSGNGNYPMAIEDLSDDEKEDYYIKDTDALIVAGKIVLSSPFRKKIIPPWKYTSTNNNATTCSCITRSCSPPSHSTSSGSR